MRLGTLVVRGAVLGIVVGAAIACSDDDDDFNPGHPSCGSGQVLQDNHCVQAAGSSSGGSTTAGTATAAGTNQGGVGDGGTSGSASLGGAGGDVGGAGSGGEPPIPVPDVVPTRWLVFSHQKGIFAYDTTKFPEADALVPLSEKEQFPYYRSLTWSPDGRTLIYVDVGEVYAVDMTGDEPGAPKLLLSNPTAPSVQLYSLAPWSWSADSSSVAFLGGTTLAVFDPTQAAPALHPLTTKVKSYSWAPVGGRLLYTDDAGTHVVQVTKGVPGTPLTLDASAVVWSPSGSALAGVQGGDLALTTLSGDQATLEFLTTAHEDIINNGEGGMAGAGGAPADPILPLDPYYIRFNKDGSKLSFSGELTDDAKFNGYTIDMKPSLGQAEPVASDAPADAATSCQEWSPDGTLLLCTWSNLGGSSLFAVDPFANTFTTLLDGGSYSSWMWSPDPSRHQLFATDYTDTPQLVMVDLANPDTVVPLFDGNATYSVSPAGTLFSYLTKPTIRLVDLAAPQNTPVDIQTHQFASDPPVWTWSPNGQFIAVADGSHQQRLVRIDGTVASTPVALQGSSTRTIYFAWQP